MNEHRTDQSEPGRGSISATSMKMLAAGLVEAIPINLPEKIVSWWTRRGEDAHLRGAHLLGPEIQRVLWNPPTIANEAKHWTRFYQFLLHEDFLFDVPGAGDHPATNWVFIPPEDYRGFEALLQQHCKRFFPLYEIELTAGTAGGNKSRQGEKYIIQIEQVSSDAWPISLDEGMEVMLAEILARELYFYFRGTWRPQNQWMYAMGSWFSDNTVPALRWKKGGLELGRFPREQLKFHCKGALRTLEP